MLRLNPEQFAAIQGRIHENASKATRQRAPRHRNKYGAEPVEIDGRRFDSKAEGRRYMLLKDMERKGEITGLECQVSFTLVPEQIILGKKERPVRYVCDFRYTRKDGAVVVEDVKSGPTRTREYNVKRKLMWMVHKVAVVEVMVND